MGEVQEMSAARAAGIPLCNWDGIANVRFEQGKLPLDDVVDLIARLRALFACVGGVFDASAPSTGAPTTC